MNSVFLPENINTPTAGIKSNDSSDPNRSKITLGNNDQPVTPKPDCYHSENFVSWANAFYNDKQNSMSEHKQSEKSIQLGKLYKALRKINKTIICIREPQKLFEETCRILVEEGPFLMTWIGLDDPDTGFINVVAQYGLDEGYLNRVRISIDKDIPEGQRPTGHALREGRIFVNNDTENNPIMKPWQKEQLKRGYKSSASFPFRMESQKVGVITMYAQERNYFNTEQLQLLQFLASAVSIAVETANIEKKRSQAVEELHKARDEQEVRVQKRTANLETMHKITKIATSSLDIVEVKQRLMENISKSFGLTFSTIYFIDEQYQELLSSAFYVYPPEYFVTMPPLTLNSDYLITDVLKTGEPLFIENIANMPLSQSSRQALEKIELLIGKQFKASIILPLKTYRRTIGVITFNWSAVQTFGPDEIEFFNSIVHEIAVGLENARLHTQTEEELARTQLLQNIAIAATTGPDLYTISQGILQALNRYIHLKRGIFYHYDEEKHIFRALSYLNLSIDTIANVKEFSLTSEEFLGSKAAQREKILTHKEDTLSPKREALLKLLGAWDTRYAAIPIKFRSKTIGIIFLSFEGNHDFSQAELALFNSIAHIACQAFENARLYDLEKKRVEELAEHRKSLEKTIQVRTKEISAINARLRQSEAQHRQIIEVSPDAYFVLVQNQIVYANPAALQLFDSEEISMIDLKNLQRLIVPEKHNELQNFRASQKPLHLGEITIVKEEGQSITVEGLVIPVLFEGEKAYQYIIRDITQRKEFEKEMARLERLNIIGEMAAGIGHEIRNPMTTVRGFLEILSSKEECEKFKEYYDLMIDELDRANSIITEFLKLARNKTVAKKQCNLNQIIQTLFPLIQSDAIKNDKYIVLDLKKIPDLLLNEKEIRQILFNLVRNGLEASPKGSHLIIRSFNDANDVVLAIEDQGEGISPDVLQKIGTPFFTTKDNGTGLGLAVCYSMAARHNAIIDIETGKKGTIFFIRFKQAEQNIQAG